jgi:S-adenosylmethionine decarboxylase
MKLEADTMPSGRHLIADLAATRGLSDPDAISAALRAAAKAARVTLLKIQVHHFGAGMGVTGVALLAESHISIHTWPETGQVALDIFVCGPDAEPDAALGVMVEALAASIVQQQMIIRLRTPRMCNSPAATD